MSRKLLRSIVEFSSFNLLQWGRDKNVSEIVQVAGVQTGGVNASMGPRQKCLGNSHKFLCFVAFSRLQWGRDKNVSEIARWQILLWDIKRLQWGRDKNVSEISRVVQYGHVDAAASMGPRQKCLGNRPYLVPVQILWLASMGPRQKCLGNMKYVYSAILSRKSLQWGRDKNVSEITQI